MGNFMISSSLMADVLNISENEARKILNSKNVRFLNYNDIEYLTFRRTIGRIPEGSVIIYSKNKKALFVPGYPQIKRALILSTAISRHFLDYIVVEEKLNGYNVRIVRYYGKILTITRGGYICPYTTQKIKELLEKLGGKINRGEVVFVEVVGDENPYTRYKYPNCNGFCFFVIDVLKGKKWLDVKQKERFCRERNLPCVKQYGIVKKDETAKLWEIIRKLEKDEREGIVLKDIKNRVSPLKYTTSYCNIGDIRDGMKFFFDEGKGYIFPRILREMFKIEEENLDKSELEKREIELGKALLESAIESINSFKKNGYLGEEFSLRFKNINEMNEFVSFMKKQGGLIEIREVKKENGEIIAKFLKRKRTEKIIEDIIKRGISPLD
ncbi:MAG: RNA ligase [Fervidicoccus fontis]|uniref:RNA ligase n=2 Tax=Fervidicoccus fontis TaxID=683846 RepID=A0A2J6N3I3_9CREN|nr:MAG: RNA ligase [Fervidicoccus fontis]PMB77383.1 MAG: RNA ligase [Fervidicoccus fontis]HEW63444.1 RNA ligase [Fervidicoccus fontis]